MKETSPQYINKTVTYIEKLTKKIPVFKEVSGIKQLAGVKEEELPTNTDVKPHILMIRKPYFFINPKISYDFTKEIILQEGCLSIPPELVIEKFSGNTNVKRPQSVSIDYIDENGKKAHINIDGSKDSYWLWFARCTQHEFDHTQGELFIDKLVSEEKPRMLI